MYESQFEEKLYNERREKLRHIAALGEKQGLSALAATYPSEFRVSAPDWAEGEGDLVPWLKRKFDSAGAPVSAEQLEAERVDVSVAGRVMAIRVQGKAGFAQIQQAGQRIQIYVRKDDVGEDAFALYKLLDLGDHIGVKGYLMRTRTGELTVHVSAGGADKPALTFLTKAMLALPDKFHGLEDTELRYRQRYLDLFVNPEVREVFVKRAAVLRAMRRFFDSRGYLEVETPMMHTIAGGAAARPFVTHHNALDIDLKLRIAPELYLKRLVVGGFDRVYEINRNFRNEGISTQHNPEFTMVEFYQAYANYHDLMELTKELVAYVAMEVNGTTKTTFNGIEIDLAPEKWHQLSMREAILRFWPEVYGTKPTFRDFDTVESFKELVGRASDSARPFLPKGTIGHVEELPRTPEYIFTQAITLMMMKTSGEFTLGKSIAELFEYLAEPHLQQPTIIYDFPLAVSPLSKVKPDEPDWVERFEFYIGGFEVGNAFSELNDPDDQRRRFEEQLKERERGDEEAHFMDEDYVRALGYGLPPTAGEGIGIDRLTMVLTGAKSIRDVILFPLMRPLAKPEPKQGE
ncbi:MAG TPA: lysine--tRNA ligase [Acidobacteriaceae bacterium]|nr:lysine--tRNA ligase [Acidobacteriaceae bacterium]